jgi:hypothetical protein
MVILALFAVGVVWVVAEYVCHDPQGFGAMVRDTEAFARSQPSLYGQKETPGLARYSLAVC